MKRAARAAAIGVLVVSAGALGIACPARDLTIHVSDTGVSTILTSCRGFQKACSAPASCADDPLICEVKDGECVLRNRCHLGDKTHPGWKPAGMKEGRLVLVSIEGAQIGDASPCFRFDPSSCLGDRGCFADELNKKLDQMIQGGLTFDGFVAQEDALLTFAIFDASGSGEAACDPDRLVTCAGLAPPLGGGDYDITCASCQDSSHFALGNDNGPCPTSKDECFLERCDRIVRALP